MRGKSYYQPIAKSANGDWYSQAFIRRVHQLLGYGYAELIPANHGGAEEEDITGELVKAVESVLDDVRAPRWIRWFSIHEDSRINDGERQGKRRLKVDIRMDSSLSNPRSRMRFEAKRLGSKHRSSIYLGSDGIKRFLDGRYARNDDFAGMLGYVQEGSLDDWAAELGNAISRDAKELNLSTSGCWRQHQLTPKLPSTYRSGHERPSVGQPIEIFHTLLLFH